MPTLPETIASALKQSTAKEHAASEAVLLPRLHSIASIQDYAAVLTTFYSFYFPLQTSVAQQISPTLLPDVSQRQTAALILTDLSALNLQPTFPSLCEELPEIRNEAEAFGVLYVLEGSTLGARQIKKMLGQNERVQIPDSALHFFTGYGADTGLRWTSFLKALNDQTEADAVIFAARQTFTLFTNWISKTLA